MLTKNNLGKFLLIFFIAIFISSNAKSEIIGYLYNLNKGGNDSCFRYLYYDDVVDCWDNGNACDVEIIYKEEIGYFSIYNNGFLLQAAISDGTVNLNIKEDDGSIQHIQRVKSYHRFNQDDFVHIISCDEYPQLNGVEVNLNGIITDAQGHYTVYIPVQP